MDKTGEEVLLSTAHYFMQAAIKLRKDIPFGDIPLGLYAPPAVNAAFATELYIKYILYKQGWIRKKKDKHDLKSLFLQIEENLRVKIVAGIYIFYKRHFPEIELDLMGKLEENKDVFQEWRYIHEFALKNMDMAVDYGFLMNLCEILKEAALSFEE